MTDPKRMPTAEELMNSEKYEPDRGISFEDYHGDNAAWVPDMMIEFARLHCLKQAKAILKNLQMEDEDLEFILSSYPLENIT